MCVRKKIGAPAFEAGGSLLLTLSTSKIFSGSEDVRGVRQLLERFAPSLIAAPQNI